MDLEPQEDHRETRQGFFGRARERVKRGFEREKSPQEIEQAQLEKLKEAADAEEAVALALSAFAVQAYLKSVLCPSLADFTPRAHFHTQRVS